MRNYLILSQRDSSKSIHAELNRSLDLLVEECYISYSDVEHDEEANSFNLLKLLLVAEKNLNQARKDSPYLDFHYPLRKESQELCLDSKFEEILSDF